VKKKEGVNCLGSVAVLAVVSLGEISNPYPLIFVKFCGLNPLSRGHLFGVNLEIILVDLLKSHQIVLSLFLVVLRYLHGFNKICHCGQNCRGLQHLSFDTKVTIIAPVICEIW
jgi:hypothetical protein